MLIAVISYCTLKLLLVWILIWYLTLLGIARMLWHLYFFVDIIINSYSSPIWIIFRHVSLLMVCGFIWSRPVGCVSLTRLKRQKKNCLLAAQIICSLSPLNENADNTEMSVAATRQCSVGTLEAAYIFLLGYMIKYIFRLLGIIGFNVLLNIFY